ncbi:glycosyltransferase family 4 protein [Chryseobacterium indoltheticum]|uniref:Lipopolysaccharide 1,2-N-acetylglucosaminetransferase n=1 Tax=Chryseobacterium indoltheticum TaxID=254 RepID=A0A381FPI8_9FLAO|nr:glycosyltransferase family 4 protein [Chryseobacterium indoltheticum]SUX48413.1 lipopolysaccharide 1,2-N-acetylglucosaminetransferase [Chryseobacterium indoltheticum]
MHILHLIKTSEGATWAVNLMRAVREKYPDVRWSVIVPKGGKHFGEYQEICDNVIDFDYSIGTDLLSKGKIFKGIIKDLNPDIIQSWFTQTTLYMRLFLRDFNRPKVFEVVGPAHLEILAFKFGDIWSSSKNDYWITTSKYIYDHYKNGKVPEDRLFLNYAFIDTEKFLSEASLVRQRDLRSEFNIPANYKIIGTASYIYPPKFFQKTGIKGHEILLEAFKVLLAKRNDIVLIIAGGTFGGNVSYEKILKEKAMKISKERIFFTGSYIHVNEVISNYDVFVYLSKSENLGGVYESLLLEIPTVSSDRGALPELVINNYTGYNVSLTNPSVIAKKIELLLSRTNTFSLSGKTKVQAIFDKEEIIDKTYLIYKDLIKRHP